MTAAGATADRLGIVELVTICDSMARRHRAVFEALGRWLPTSDAPDGAIGRVLVEACHRHAELADLWAAREPAIPVEPLVAPPATAGDDVLAWYREELAAVRADTSALHRRIDVDLDPSTRRVIERVDADLGAIAGRLA